MSGGVDSSVAAALLVEQGHRVIGVTLNLAPRTVSVSAGKPTCCGVSEIADARRVCERLGIPHYVFDMREEFGRAVIDDFVAEYARGRTPNPCIRCNQIIKFETLRRKAHELGASAVATGHYARIALGGGICKLLRGVDASKDQSYFLYTLTQEQMAATVFPNGGLRKSEVRTRAAELGLPVADKPESQDICFVPQGGYAQLVAERSQAPPKEGDIVHIDGTILGRHEGISRYTIGQRRGIGVAWTEPLYVVRIDPDNNLVIVGPDRALWQEEFLIEGTNFAPDVPLGSDVDTTCRVRHNMDDVPARLIRWDDGAAGARFLIPVRAISPGQAAVFYDGERVLGGGTISEVIA